jgi:hypothetical protein
MKIRLVKTGSVRFLLSFALLGIPAASVAQLSETAPPVKMGLWQTESTSTVTGLENTPMAAMAGRMGSGQTHKSQSCLTPETWRKGIQGINERQRNGCTMSNMEQNAHEVSFDQVCDSGGGSKHTAHVHILIDSDEHAHGTVVMKMEEPNFPQPVNINMNMTSQYLGSSCGDVKPGDGKVVH